MANDPHWMEKAAARMKAKGTVGKFGKATGKKIAAGKRAGGERKKQAVFAQNAKKARHGIGKDHPHHAGAAGEYSPHNAIKHHHPR